MGKIEKSTARYFELLAKEEKLKREGKSMFGEIVNKTENLEDMKELSKWQVLLESEIYFSDRNSYLEVLQDYLEEKIDLGVFYGTFFSLWSQHRDRSREREEELRKNPVSTIWLDSRAYAFSGLVSRIFSLNENLTDDLVDDDDDDDLNDLIEKEHRTDMQELYLEMKKLLQEE